MTRLMNEWLIGFAIIIIIPFVDFVFPTHLTFEDYYYIMGAGFVVSFFREALQTRFFKIEIDRESSRIFFYSKNFFSKVKKQSLSFENAKLEFRESKSIWNRKTLTLFFLKNKMEVAEINKHKDGFPLTDLTEIKKIFEIANLPISKY